LPILRDTYHSTTFCVVGARILGDPWSILIVRELLLGSNRFNLLQRGLPRISPTVLNTRLKELEARGVIIKRRQKNARGHDYLLTPAGRELSTVIESLAVWGMRWAREEMDSEDFDVSFLMFDIQRRIDAAALPDGETVLCFNCTDIKNFKRWWLVCEGSEIDLCYENPGKDVDIYVTASSKNLIEVWMGDMPLTKALQSDAIQLVGERHLIKSFPKWFTLSAAAHTPRPKQNQPMLVRNN
jgi:DNA-binding HxlR family transcriptional regulator